MPRHPLTVEDLWALPRVGNPVPSPDGGRVIVPVTTYDMKTNEGRGRLWLVPAGARGAGDGRKGDPARPLTCADVSSGQPAWSPDGTRLAFVRKPGETPEGKSGPEHGDKPQLYVLDLEGGEAARRTDLPYGAIDPRWFPNGRRIAFLSEVHGLEPDLEAAARRKKDEADDPVKAACSEDRWFRHWDRWLTHGRVHHVFVLDLDSDEVFDLTPESGRRFSPMDPTGNYAIAPDGKEIAFSACRSEPPYDHLDWGIFTVRVPARIGPKTNAGLVLDITPDEAANAVRPVYSPDGRYLVYGLNREWDFYADKIRLVVRDRASGNHKVLTEDWDRSAASWNFADDRTLLVLAEVEARHALFALDVPKARRSARKNPPRKLCQGGTMSEPRPAGDRIVVNRSTLREPPEIVSFARDGKGRTRLTAFTKPGMKEIELSPVEQVVFEGAEGDPVQMFVLHPPGTNPKTAARRRKKPPLVHMIHGGPHGVFGDQWHWRWNAQAFAAPGYAVALVNFHGSTGWGQDFAASILGRWGDQPYDDILAATDVLVERKLVDPDRVAVTGGSYGGYLVSWIASQTDRFRCIVNHAGVSDFQTQFASDVTHGRVRSMGGSPWENQDALDRWNPMRHAEGFASPMLVLHGEKDYRVPYAQGLEIYAVYKARGLPARLVVYPDENHWILKPRSSRHWYGEVLAWLWRWLEG